MKSLRLMRPLAEPLNLAADEMADLARLGDKVEALVARMAGQVLGLDADLIRDAQAVDLFTQRLVGLAAFLRALADAAPADAKVELLAAIRDLTLTDQAQRLAGVVQTESQAPAVDHPTLFWD